MSVSNEKTLLFQGLTLKDVLAKYLKSLNKVEMNCMILHLFLNGITV